MARPVRCAVVLPLDEFGRAREAATAAEALGFHAIAAEDHFFMRGAHRSPDEPRLECFTLLSALVPVTRSIVLTQIVTANSFRHPALLAKIVSTLHHIAGGRVELGIGAGWFREEYEAFGFPYPPPSVRIAQLAEALEVIKRLWTEPAADFAGEFYRLRGAPHAPKPVPRPRIMIGGGGTKLLRVAARHADVANIIPPATGARGAMALKETLAFTEDDFRDRVAVLEAECRAIGRDPGEIELSGMLFVVIAENEAGAQAMAEATAQMFGLTDIDAIRRSPNVLVGTPEQCVAELRRRADVLGVTYQFCNFPVPGTLELFGRKVLPHLG